jgi:hypothetical protein
MSAPADTALDHLRRAVEALKAERLTLDERHYETENERERLDDMTRWLRSMESVLAAMEEAAFHDQRKGVAA